tara:strand:- start:623 stop:1021 length:399 start_codon:yes stop_codon:yes gene_type:complete
MIYIIILSLVLNAALLMAVLGSVYFSLYISIIFNLAAVWYIYKLINRYNEINEEVDGMLDSIRGLGDHLESIHELEMFYGEPVIQSLIEHIATVENEIESYSFNNDLNYEIVEDDEDDEEENREEDREESKE